MKLSEIIDTFANRLLYAMKIRNMKPIQLHRITKISLTNISFYKSGKYKPKQDGTQLLAEALNVDPLWLMGYDVPMEKNIKKSEDYFEYTAIDDAMFPVLGVGDIAFIKKQDHITPPQENSTSCGTYLIELDNTTTVRDIFESVDKQSYTLRGRNVLCQPIDMNKDDFNKTITVLGRVVRVELSSAFK